MRLFLILGNAFFAAVNAGPALDGRALALVAVVVCSSAIGFLIGGKYGG